MKLSVKKAIVILLILATIGVIIVVAAIAKKEDVVYVTAKVAKGKIVQTVSETGSLKAINEIDLNFLNSGKLAKINYQIGDKVKPGYVIAELDYRSLIIRKEEAQANLDINNENLNKLLEIKDDKKIEEFVNIILKAKKKYIIALRTSFSLGHFLYFKMRKIVPNVFLFNNYDQGIYDIIQDLNPEDVVIAISFPRFTNLTINIAKYAKNKGIKLVSITDSRISPLYKISNVCLLCPYKGFTFFNSNVAAMALINSIINRIFNFHYNSGTNHLKKEDSVLLDFNIWYKEKGYHKNE